MAGPDQLAQGFDLMGRLGNSRAGQLAAEFMVSAAIVVPGGAVAPLALAEAAPAGSESGNTPALTAEPTLPGSLQPAESTDLVMPTADEVAAFSSVSVNERPTLMTMVDNDSGLAVPEHVATTSETASEAGTRAVALVLVAGNPESGTVAQASDSSDPDQCVQAGLVPPAVLVAKLYEAGKPNQTMKAIFQIDAMPDGCAGQEDRYLAMRILMQDGRHMRHYVYLDPGEIKTWQDGGILLNGASTGGPSIIQNVHSRKDDYTWICGRPKPIVKVQTANRVEDANGNVIAGPNIHTTRARVQGAKCEKP